MGARFSAGWFAYSYPGRGGAAGFFVPRQVDAHARGACPRPVSRSARRTDSYRAPGSPAGRSDQRNHPHFAESWGGAWDRPRRRGGTNRAASITAGGRQARGTDRSPAPASHKPTAPIHQTAGRTATQGKGPTSGVQDSEVGTSTAKDRRRSSSGERRRRGRSVSRGAAPAARCADRFKPEPRWQRGRRSRTWRENR